MGAQPALNKFGSPGCGGLKEQKFGIRVFALYISSAPLSNSL
jgi:hypothetical protein